VGGGLLKELKKGGPNSWGVPIPCWKGLKKQKFSEKKDVLWGLGQMGLSRTGKGGRNIKRDFAKGLLTI